MYNELLNCEFKFTKEQLIKAFKIYNTQSIENKDDFVDITDDKDAAEAQVDHLLSILQKIVDEAEKEYFAEDGRLNAYGLAAFVYGG